MTDSTLRILKSPDATGSEIKRLFSNARLVKRDVIASVEQAQAALHSVQSELASIRAEAEQQGLENAQREATQLLIGARREYEDARRNAEADAIDFAFALAAKIVDREITRDPETVVSIVGALLQNVRDRRELVVLANPEDFDALTAALPRLQQSIDDVPIRIESRRDIEPGGCVIETATGRIDGRLETQLKILREAMESP